MDELHHIWAYIITPLTCVHTHTHDLQEGCHQYPDSLGNNFGSTIYNLNEVGGGGGKIESSYVELCCMLTVANLKL